MAPGRDGAIFRIHPRRKRRALFLPCAIMEKAGKGMPVPNAKKSRGIGGSREKFTADGIEAGRLNNAGEVAGSGLRMLEDP